MRLGGLLIFLSGLLLAAHAPVAGAHDGVEGRVQVGLSSTPYGKAQLSLEADLRASQEAPLLALIVYSEPGRKLLLAVVSPSAPKALADAILKEKPMNHFSESVSPNRIYWVTMPADALQGSRIWVECKLLRGGRIESLALTDVHLPDAGFIGSITTLVNEGGFTHCITLEGRKERCAACAGAEWKLCPEGQPACGALECRG